MTDPMTPEDAARELPSVTQADRDRAAHIAWLNGRKNKVVDRYKAGELDASPVVEELAKHRLAALSGREELPAKIAYISAEQFAGVQAALTAANARIREMEGALAEIATMGYAGAPDIQMRKIARAALGGGA